MPILLRAIYRLDDDGLIDRVRFLL